MTSTTGKNESPGVTLIELLVVLVVLGVSFAVILPSFRESYRNLQVNAVVGELEKNIRYAQYHSVMAGKRYLLRYDQELNSYRFLCEKSDHSRIEWIPLEGGWGRTKKLPKNITLWFRGKEKILFFPNGAISEGDIAIKAGSQTEATLYLGRSLRGVDIERKGLTHAA